MSQPEPQKIVSGVRRKLKTFAPGDCVSAERIDIISLFEHR